MVVPVGLSDSLRKDAQHASASRNLTFLTDATEFVARISIVSAALIKRHEEIDDQQSFVASRESNRNNSERRRVGTCRGGGALQELLDVIRSLERRVMVMEANTHSL